MKRGSGILLHITSLPSAYGIGDFGPEAYRFVDWLVETKQSYWQILPLNPTDLIYDNSPYHSNSAFALNPLLLSPEQLVADGLLDNQDLESASGGPDMKKEQVDYEKVIDYKAKILNKAYENCLKQCRAVPRALKQFKKFCLDNKRWLDDYALFMALKSHFQGKFWCEWSKEIRDRKTEALRVVKKELKDKIEKEKFLQYVCYKQWSALKDYCHKKRIQIIGDIPIYVEYNSVDLWTNPQIFRLNEEMRSCVVAGVPPDYFSETGQLWGNPVYNWDVLKNQKYDWWIKRLAHNLELFDIVRIDHFRGLVAYWEIPANEKTAINGRWVQVPVYDFFNCLSQTLDHFKQSGRIIAEDLGIITPDVVEVIKRYGFPGMKVLLFAFGEDNPKHPYLPHNFQPNCVVYTGTHDNNTVKGWFENEAFNKEKERLFNYLGHEVSGSEVHWELIQLAMKSAADLAIIPMQDILGLGQETRMNRPAVKQGNWRWRLPKVDPELLQVITQRLMTMTETYGRAR
jgi:4-alpha-glucanotransferase